MKKYQITYEVTVYDGNQKDAVSQLAKISLENFSGETDRFIQIDETVQLLFSKAESYKLHLMKPSEISHLSINLMTTDF
jgi:hypothetical protein